MEHQAIVETVFKGVVEALPAELGALLGQELSCSAPSCALVSKEALFGSDPRPKSTLAHLKVSGDHEGEAFLVLPVKTSIIFGGTLIMLPQDQIDENAASDTLDGEVADAYGEVANILAGVLTQVFLDKYSKNLRFVRTEVDELVDTKVDVASDQPFPPAHYFHVTTNLKMGDQDLGRLEVVTPATILDLDEAAASDPEPVPEAESPAAPQSQAPAPPAAEEAVEEEAPAASRPPFADAKKVADVVLKATLEQVAEEVGALLGQSFACSDIKLEMLTKEDFFGSRCLEKSTLTYMDVTGDAEGRIYLMNQVKDAILMGGTLIMLPEEEIEAHIGKGEFDGEVADAYGEVANIISGGLTQTFQDRFPQALRFVKTSAEVVVPTKIVPADDKPFAAGLYYVASCAISLQEKPLERLFLLFPAAVLGLDGYQQEAAVAAEPQASGATAATPAPTAAAASGGAGRPAPPPPPADATPVVLVIADSVDDADAIKRNLTSEQYDIEVIGYKDDVRGVFSAHPVLGVFLLMSEVGEKGFSVAIKLQSSGYPLPPMIAGGPEWTRSAVLKAVKYGARDILVTPASDDEIREKASQHISALA